MREPLIRLVGIVKKFPGVVANDGVDLTIDEGSIHAVVGENGAGKSTLMKILYGSQKPDAGEVWIRGVRQNFGSAKDAIDCGVGMVFQHFKLAANFTVWENVVLGCEPGSAVRINSALAKQQIMELSVRYGLHIDPNSIVGELGVGERQRVEILKVLYRGAKVIILDEPTAVLVPQEVESLFGSLKDLVANGVTVVFISHKLDEVLNVADRITVMRAGRTVAEIDVSPNISRNDLARMMIGADLPRPEAKRGILSERIILELQNVSVETQGRKLISDVSLSVREGEIVGIAGVEGNGQTELLEVILGLKEPDIGSILLEGEEIRHWSVRDRRDKGIGYIPSDRQYDGLMLSATLWENVALGHQRGYPASSNGFMTKEPLRRHTKDVVDQFDVRTPGVDVIAYALSGGNQQKLVVGREMLSHPNLLLAAHPTRGIDVGVQALVWASLREAKREGKGLLLVSADLDELIGLSDVLLVLFRGSIVARLDPQSVSPEVLGSYMTGANL